jgi:hypothetical protein
LIVNGTLVEDKMCRFKGECAHFRFNKYPIYTHDGAIAKLSTNSQETDNSALPAQIRALSLPEMESGNTVLAKFNTVHCYKD